MKAVEEIKVNNGARKHSFTHLLPTPCAKISLHKNRDHHLFHPRTEPRDG